jgi:MFS family permease
MTGQKEERMQLESSGRALAEPASVAEEWRLGWRAVAASFVAITFSILHFYSLGVFLVPLTKAYGWTKSEITLAPTIIATLNFFAAAPIGRLASRIGVRRVALPGFVGYCLALAALGLAGPRLWTWYALWAVFALCAACSSNSLWSLSVATRFNRSRGLALAVALCGTGVAGAIAPIAASTATRLFGWSAAYGLLGASGLIIGLPLIYWLLPRGPARIPAAAGPRTAPGPEDEGTEALPGFTFREALATRYFWILAFASGVLGIGVPTLMLHFVSIGIQMHMTANQAAAAATFIGIAAILGRLATGLLMDTLPGRFVACGLFAVPSIACLLLLGAHGAVGAMSVAAFVIGLCAGAEFDVLAVLVSRYLGMREFAAINGQIVAVFGLGVGFGPMLGSLVVDHFGSYDILLEGLAIAFLLPSAAVLLLGAPLFRKPGPPSAPKPAIT